jgi:uncharacterized protein (DUF2249 family)
MTSDSHFENTIFRYRSSDALLGEREELERQTIYFSPPEYLNDPMEGFRQVYWRGDRITWRNLLRHYVICMHNRFLEALLTEDTERLAPNTIAVFQSLDNFSTPQAKSLCEACIAAIEAGNLHAALLDLLASSKRNISFSELQKLLRTVHIDWLSAVRMVFAERDLVPNTERQTRDTSSLINALRELQTTIPQFQDQYSNIGVDVLHEAQQHMAEQMTLLSATQHANVLGLKRETLFLEFTSEYLNSLLKLVYPPWYVACFSARHDNAAMWSYYADNHRGCCLVFRKQQTDDGIKLHLNGPSGYGTGGIVKSDRDMTLNPVRYAAHEQHIEFFANIGRLPLGQILRNWFRDDDGDTSPLAEHLKQERQEAWRNSYWKNFTPPLLHKLPDWLHEEEFRIVISDSLGIRDSHEGRTFTYDYDTLEGIIFGINTSLLDKVRMMRILDKKLDSRTVSEPFKFFQAHYNARSGRIEAHHMSLIKRE